MWTQTNTEVEGLQGDLEKAQGELQKEGAINIHGAFIIWQSSAKDYCM